MEAVGLDLGGNINYLQDLAVSADGSNLLDIIDQNVPGYHRVTKTDPFQDPLDDEPFCCMHRQHILTSVSGAGGGLGSVTSAMCETASLDLSPNITEDFQKMYSDWQQHLGSLQASEEEDLVVDEVVSLSVGRGSTPCSSTANARQRSESVCSVTGPCVPPDLLLDSGRHQVTAIENSEVEDENVLTEIAGILDGDFPLEDSVIIPDDGISSAPGVKVCGEDVIDVEVQDGGADLEEVVVEDEEEEEEEAVAYSGSQIEGNVKSLEETKVVKSEDIQIGGGFRSVAELIGNKSQSLVCKKIKSKQGPREQTLQVDEKDIQLQAGSIILAVVNESGSLVPLPQLQMKNTKLTNAIKVEASPEKATEEEIDVETVTEKAPVLEAGDVDSLLAQFEASEAVNTPSRDRSDGKSRNINSIQSISISNLKSVRPTCLPGTTNTQASPQGSPTHQKIKNALPKEIIEKIKASTKRKSTQMLLEPLVVRKGRVVRQQETNQHRSKAHRASTNAAGQQAVNDRVPPPLDHDYCFSPDKQKKGKNAAENTSQAGDYLNKLPDYYTAKVSKGDNKKAINSTDDNHDDNGKKDSGVESGDVSDASVETEDRRKDARTIKSDRRRDNWDNGKNEDVTEKEIDEDIYDKLPPYMTDIGNSKPKDDEDDAEDGGVKEECEDGGVKEECEVKEEEDEEEERQQQEEVKKIKRKLNLSEYRQRLQSAHSSRCPSPSQTDAMPKSPQENPVSLGELIQKMENAEEKTKESTDSEVPEIKSADSDPVVAVVEDVEEGELKGDSDHEMSKTTSDADSKLKTLSDGRIEKKAPFTSPSSLNGSTSVSSREGRKSSSQGYASRRWSSSSHSRSRSRSPNVRRKHHSSSYSRSSRDKRRRAHRSSRSSVSPCRCWSRSRSRSCSRSRGGRSSSESSYCSSTCSDSSKSRSRSRSHSSKKRERRSYSRRRYSGNWERRRRSRSWSRSSSRYSRGRRSRSPLWRDGRSRSPSRRSMRPRRREDENRVKQVEERRVIYVGRISEGTTKAELRHRFSKFGSIVDISVHFREHGDNYGFVTYKNKDEAYNAVEHGNEDPTYPRYDLCFGGRRAFCRVQYSDLDAQDEPPSYVGSSSSSSSVPGPKVVANTNVDFDSLLRAAMKRKTR